MNEIKWTNGALYKDLESGYTFQVEDNRNLRCMDTGKLAHEVLSHNGLLNMKLVKLDTYEDKTKIELTQDEVFLIRDTLRCQISFSNAYMHSIEEAGNKESVLYADASQELIALNKLLEKFSDKNRTETAQNPQGISKSE